jgi:hypothetical protein
MLTSLYPRYPRWGAWNGLTPPPDGGPVNTIPPAVTGNGVVGALLTCTDPGTWNPLATSYAYHWLRSDGTYLNASFNLPEYTVTDNDVGMNICCEVTAMNDIAPCLVVALSNVIDVLGSSTTGVPTLEEPRKSEF